MSPVAQARDLKRAETLGAAIPVIDISPFIANRADAGRVVAQLAEACRTIGFFMVTGHGVDAAATDRLYALARAFFDLRDATKRATGGDRGVTGGLSFAPMATEALSATIGKATLGDYKESLNYGPRLAGDHWPSAPASLHDAFSAYFAEMERLALHLRRMMCRAIGLPEDHFEPAFQDHLSALRVINYPEPPEALPEGQVRAGEHTDYGFLTILRSEAAPGGLQVKTRSGDWLDVPAIDGAFVVNIADGLMRWTNDAWVSTPHRVANPPAATAGSRRQSIPFFHNPNAAALIECLPAFCPPGQPARYAPISFGDYIALKTSQAFRK